MEGTGEGGVGVGGGRGGGGGLTVGLLVGGGGGGGLTVGLLVGGGGGSIKGQVKADAAPEKPDIPGDCTQLENDALQGPESKYVRPAHGPGVVTQYFLQVDPIVCEGGAGWQLGLLPLYPKKQYFCA